MKVLREQGLKLVKQEMDKISSYTEETNSTFNGSEFEGTEAIVKPIITHGPVTSACGHTYRNAQLCKFTTQLFNAMSIVNPPYQVAGEITNPNLAMEIDNNDMLNNSINNRTTTKMPTSMYLTPAALLHKMLCSTREYRGFIKGYRLQQ
ncbi:hypothetical protein CVS40_8450 [Lucilia cuprina]|nr:hypothetical protein CVS40_8450 [Lucilia cuprina]